MIIKNLFINKQNRRKIDREKLILKKNISKLKNYYNFGYDYFDNPKLNFGYGGYKYDGRYENNVNKIIKKFKLNQKYIIAEFGCAKGYVLTEFKKKGFNVIGFEKSKYAIKNAHQKVFKNIFYIKKVNELKNYNFDFMICKDVLPSLTKKEIEELIKISILKSKLRPYFVIQTFKKKENQDKFKFWDKTHKCLFNITEWKLYLKKFDKKIFYSFNELF